MAEIRHLHDQDREGRAASAALSPSKRMMPANDNRPPLRLILWRGLFFAALLALLGGLLADHLGLY
ncbi:MAG TPA: hypothetical protein VM661_17305 [Candidatus Sulfotelmatobacter sp.]|nr:hypothetical protein [Candidatus Sulfotelmatobacter sp.]